MSLQGNTETLNRDNLFAQQQQQPAITDVLSIAANQNLVRGTLLTKDGYKIPKTTTAPVAAYGIATFTGVPTADDTMTIGSTTLTFKAEAAGDTQVTIGDDASETIDNIIAKLPNTVVGTKSEGGTELTITAKTVGTSGNDIALSVSVGLSEVTLSHLSSGKLSGGVDGVYSSEVWAVLAEDCNTSAGSTKDAPVYMSGEFNKDAVIYGANTTESTVKENARKVGIFLKEVL